ncbi:hypothetical protein BBP00_00005991 [Phytophthora kernoviae]|uniref:C3H1-type domain-containing protein n=1 Tax=Phytophthora kernoviae TaxID=325452 RepID=A0A3F2RNU1_9STRA|nr:hypothetical protein BBP00_00005991 [Phytophthora kernoviae]
MKYSEDESSPSGSGDNNGSKVDVGTSSGAEVNNNEVLPPHSLSLTNNQTSHERDDDSTVVEDAGRHYANDAANNASVSSDATRTIDIKVRKTCPPMEMVPSRNSHRKNSIEMFLSQSPSQALGGDFLKLSMDDRQMSLQANERVANGNGTSGNGPSGTGSASSYGSGQFQLNPVQESPSEYGSLAGRYRHQQPSPGPQQQQQERYRSNGRETQQQHLATSLSIARSTSVPGTSSAPSSAMYMNPRSSPMRHPHAQMGYGSQVPMGMRGGGHSNGRTSGRSIYSRMTPPLPESSPPHSPRKGMGGGMQMGMTKQCKFFLQGHCRMGGKCKFAHQTGASTPEHMGGGHNSNRQNASMMYQQSRMMMSPPTHLMQQRHLSGEDLGHQVNGSYGGRQQSRMGYRSNDGANMSSMGLGLMNGGGMSAPIMGGSANDPSSLSAALSVEDIQNRVFAMSKDQNGCRLLQEQLDYEDRADLCEVIYQESLEHLAEMMVDPFGNYLFQKLLERVNEKQRLVIIRRVSSNLVAAALNLHGTRSVQKVVEVCATSPEVIEEDYEEEDGEEYDFATEREERPEGGQRRTTNLPDIIVDALKDDAVRLCIDSNGNHVIQRALQFMKPEYNQFVFDAVCKECTTVGTHRHGCCVLQRCLDAANKAQKAEVIEQVERQAMKLMQDPYGNYVVQYVLDSCTAEEAFGVIMKPLGHIYELSVQKFSSNVIEKCLEKAPERVRQKYIAEITGCPKMNKMLQDQFANYVVQRALCVCAEEQCLLLVKAIRPHLAAMKNTSGGRRITARILKRFPNMDISMDMGISPTADALFDNGSNGLMMSHLPSPAGGYGMHHQQHMQPNMYGMHGGGHMGAAHHLQGGRGSRMPQMHGGDGSMMMMNDVSGMGMNATSRA